MDRRQALKNIGMGAGFLVATPTIMSLLQSCENEPEFNTVFIAKNEGHALRHIVDLIIPSDDLMKDEDCQARGKKDIMHVRHCVFAKMMEGYSEHDYFFVMDADSIAFDLNRYVIIVVNH